MATRLAGWRRAWGPRDRDRGDRSTARRQCAGEGMPSSLRWPQRRRDMGPPKNGLFAFRHTPFAKGQAAIDAGRRYAGGKVEQCSNGGNLRMVTLHLRCSEVKKK